MAPGELSVSGELVAVAFQQRRSMIGLVWLNLLKDLL